MIERNAHGESNDLKPCGAVLLVVMDMTLARHDGMDLRSLRLRAGFSQADLGISRQTAVDLELGRKLPGVRVRAILSRRLRVTPEQVDEACRESVAHPPLPHSTQPGA